MEEKAGDEEIVLDLDEIMTKNEKEMAGKLLMNYLAFDKL